MSYVDGFLAAVPSASRDTYKAYAERAAAIFKELGAVRVVECWGDDVPEGEVTSFPMAVKRAADETVVFSWIVWPDRATREAGWQRMMQDDRIQDELRDMPFDGKRMIYGGFEMLIDL